MKLYVAAMAAALAVSGVGCTTINGGKSFGPFTRPHDATRGAAIGTPHVPNSGVLTQAGWHRPSGACGEACGGCGECVGGCSDGACGGLFQRGCGPQGGCAGEGCLQRGLSNLLDCNGGCNGNGGGCLGGHANGGYNFPQGPPVGQTAYPYYTTRGPRDFLMANPPSIGPR